MFWIVKNLWLIPALPFLAAGLSAVLPQRHRRASATLAIGSMIGACLLSVWALGHAIGHYTPNGPKEFYNFTWLQFAAGNAGLLQLGWVLDPLAAVMLVMVSFVGLLIFIYSVGYMADDENYTRFFCFMSLFAGAMLGVVLANSLLLLFICWELVGLTSYLLIGFWYQKPSAAAAGKKAFITTRIGDVAFLLGMVWLYHETGTLLFYADGGAGCLEQSALVTLVAKTTSLGLMVSTAIGLLLFAGAVGKSGQVPLHVWLPDAMEGPTPVSALIHAATMVAAGVFLVARVYPLMTATVDGIGGTTTALQVVTWVGAITAFFAATIAVAQNDIKRILAYSTVSQLGYMMIGLGVGGVAVGMFHLITHAFFKALLFMGAGSVIHGCRGEQDIRKMGEVRRFMPLTFFTYAVGMMALAGVPFFFAGFWSKDAILHAAHGWSLSSGPFYLALAGVVLTAFYMTRQMALVFWGQYRGYPAREVTPSKTPELVRLRAEHEPHESPGAMTLPLLVLAICVVALGAVGTPWWPWLQSFLGADAAEGFTREVAQLMVVSTLAVFVGVGFGLAFYGYVQRKTAAEPDLLEKALPLGMYEWFAKKYGIDELYELTVIRFNAWAAKACAFLDQWVWGGVVTGISYVALMLSWVSRAIDEFVINLGFDRSCAGLTRSGKWMSRWQDGQVQHYLRIIGVGLVALVLFLVWGGVR
ncbi:MAG: NADH-quinone oxidoreductase subunit L [Verrucomicrobia bacterium]|nr:NADH-quinone oxidoreductase subunit L [Verrucomicrobiota bacterium]